jgi:hypothetical protein
MTIQALTLIPMLGKDLFEQYSFSIIGKIGVYSNIKSLSKNGFWIKD